MDDFIRIDGVTKRFGDFTAVDDISLRIRKGERFALLGGSGSGKSTLLRMLAGLETPAEGRIHIDGSDVTDLQPYRRPVNLMFQSYALFPHMTVRKNIAYGLKHDDLSRAEINYRVVDALSLVQMDEFGDRKPSSLSGGQRQRVALARALIKRPKVLLLDEPLGALDKKLREETQFELVSIQEKIGTTFIIVTHDQEEAMSMADRIAIMDQGVITQIDTPVNIYEFPNSRFAADFIGSINFFEGRLQDQRDVGTVLQCDEQLTVHSTMAPPDDVGTQFVAAIRPEKIRIAPGEEKLSDENSCVGSVTKIGYLGGLSTYHVTLPGGTLVVITQPNTHRSHQAGLGVSIGDKVSLSWDASAVNILV